MVLPYVCEYLHIVSDIGMEKLKCFFILKISITYLCTLDQHQICQHLLEQFLRNPNNLGKSTAGSIIFLMSNVPI